MGLLLKALKQAETDRKTARVVQQTGQADGVRGHADARMAGGEKPHGDTSPIATRARTVAPTPFSTVAPSPIPAALRVHEAGALQLRLDRRVDAIGRDAPPRGNVK